MEYSYPIKPDWSTAEIIAVAAFYEAVEKAYESGITGEELMVAYREFKKVVPSMAEEKTLCKEFEDASGYVCYRVVQAAKKVDGKEEIKGIPSR